MTQLQRITVRTSKQYDILMKKGLLADAAEHISAVLPPEGRRCCVVCDETVCALYGQKQQPLMQGLVSAGYSVFEYIFKPGEDSKTIASAEDLCRFLSQNRFSRHDFIIALGGGVCGDLAGFAASIYMRGIPYVQIPATLLAMADSSVGGKTGVNTEAGKNMIGTFWQPELVLMDPDVLDTLEERHLLNGLAEIIKAGFIGDGSIFDAIGDNLCDAILKAIHVKRKIIEEDEREAGERRLLNLGHTIGHAIEKCSSYTVPHGYAVMTGMYLTSLAADDLGWSEKPVSGLIKTVMDAFAYPVYLDYSAKELSAAAACDKKRDAETIIITYPDKPGRCTMKSLPISELEDFISNGLAKAAEH